MYFIQWQLILKIVLCLCKATVIKANTSRIDTSARIIGGQDAQEGELKYQLLLANVKGNTDEVNLMCGAALIDKMFALSARQCFEKGGKWNEIIPTVLGGLVKWPDYYTQNIFPQLAVGYKIFWHPDYDIAILRVTGDPHCKTGFNVTNDVKPINYYRASESYKLTSDLDKGDSVGTVSGYGLTSPEDKIGDAPNNLKMVDVKILEQDKCKQYLRNMVHLPSDVNKNQFPYACTYSEGKGVCQGDTGGPLVYNNKLFGVISSTGCAKKDQYSVHVRTDYFDSWIQDVLDGKIAPNMDVGIGSIVHQELSLVLLSFLCISVTLLMK